MSYRIHVNDQDYSHLVKIYLLQDRQDGIFSITIKDRVYTQTKVDELVDENVEPFLVLERRMFEAVAPLLVTALSKKGFERPSESTLRGENGAMKAHLADLRTMLKLK